jgi:membrane dipeptidase
MPSTLAFWQDAPDQPTRPRVTAKRKRRRLLVIDGLNTSRLDRAHIVRCRRGGVVAFHVTVARPQASWDEALASLEQTWRDIEALDGEVLVATRSEDITRAHDEGRTAAILGVQNALPIGTDLRRVGILRRLGVRIVQLTYNERNLFGDGCTEFANEGLSQLGKRLVTELNHAGILIDVSHCGERTTLDTLERSTRSVAVTHANVRALCDTPRNKSDRVIRSVGAAGGIVGVAFWAPLSGVRRRPTIDDLVTHITHIMDVGGPGTPAIGSDLTEGVFRNAEQWERGRVASECLYPEVTTHVGDWYRFEHRYVEGLGSLAQLGRLKGHLTVRGVRPATVAGVLGENFLRVFKGACG